MTDINKQIMTLFPAPETLVGDLARADAVTAIARVAEASRAAFDQITEVAEYVLTVDEKYQLGKASEYLAALAVDVYTWE